MKAIVFIRFVVIGALACCSLSGCSADRAPVEGDREQASPVIASEGDDEWHAPRDRFVTPRSVPVYSGDVAPLLDKYCMSCHDSTSAEGGVNLEVLRDGPPDPVQRSLMRRIVDNLRSESMPPGDEPCPDAEELEIVNSWLDANLIEDGGAKGRVTIRRLNRAEYNNTIRDLVGLDLRPANEFTSDDIGDGFDNVADVLSTPPILLEMYQAAADRVIDKAFRDQNIRERLLSAPVDTVPLAFRRYKPAVLSPRQDKVFKAPIAAPDLELVRQQHIYDNLRAFCDRAFRRPVTHDELTRLLGIVLSAEHDGEPPDSAIQLAFRAVLASPRFLFLGITQNQGSGTPSDRMPDNDFGLAARLSYFLWSSMPDEELYRLAAQGALRRAGNLRAQVERMLRDRRSRALAENFASQWLQIRKLKEFTPDPTLFPDVDEPLKVAMVEETVLFFDSIRDEDRSVLELLDADYSFANERLARHYGLTGIMGDWFRRVSLTGTPRGGVLTQASVLAATSNPTRTSPVKRGKWILENILGAPPAPPPSGVEALKEREDRGAATTLRQKMARHRTDAACASCHRRMDPLGFGLENFDAIGGWRSHEAGQPIESTGQLPGGRSFKGPAELKAVLLSRRNAFARCLTGKLLTYALGRGLESADRRHVDDIVARLTREDYRFSALVLAVVESEPFLHPLLQIQRESQ